MASDLDVVNEALIRLGVPPVSSLSDRTAQSLAAATIFDNKRRELLSDHPWYFALREATLPKLALEDFDKKFTGYRHAYQLPTDYVRVLGLRSYDYFQLAGRHLYTNDSKAQLVYVADVGASAWPSHFRQLMVHELAAAFSMPLTDNTQRAELFYGEAQRARPRARAIDSQQTPPYVFNLMRVYTRRSHNPLTQA